VIFKYPGLVVEKTGFRAVENSQITQVSGSGKPGLEALVFAILRQINEQKLFQSNQSPLRS